jgi:hypothetical protein
VYQLTAWARRLKVQNGATGDGDWHIELTGTKTSPTTKCIVIETPPDTLNPKQFNARQDFLATITNAHYGRFIPCTRSAHHSKRLHLGRPQYIVQTRLRSANPRGAENGVRGARFAQGVEPEPLSSSACSASRRVRRSHQDVGPTEDLQPRCRLLLRRCQRSRSRCELLVHTAASKS